MSDQNLINEKMRLIEHLTGINSSKINYYTEVKKQNNRLEIIHQIIKDINIDMSLADIIERVYQRLPLVVHCEFLGLALMQEDDLVMTAMVPHCSCIGDSIPSNSLIWKVIKNKKSKVYSHVSKQTTLFDCPPIKKLNLASLSLDPLIVKGDVIGVLLIGSSRENAYLEDEMNFTRQLADQLSICIENARLYEQVLRSKTEWEETFRALSDPILLIDNNHNILRCNNRVIVPENNGKRNIGKCYSYVWNRDKKCDPCLMDEVKSSKAPAYRRLQMELGQTFDVHYYPVFKDNGLKVDSYIQQVKDVTEQVKMEAQLMQSDKLAAIGEMAAGVAHELNSPMTVIIGNSQMILRELDKGDNNSELLRDIYNCGLRCKKIIQNLLTFSRQDQRPMTWTSFNDVIDRVLSLIQYQINRNNVEITVQLDPNLPKVLANEHQLDQVLINLLLNARDALENSSNPRKICISTKTRKDGNKTQAIATITDNGEGIAKENELKIFNPFYTTKEASKGTGLGLSVSLGIAEAHGGTIEVTSRSGKGSSFSLVLPVNQTE